MNQEDKDQIVSQLNMKAKESRDKFDSAMESKYYPTAALYGAKFETFEELAEIFQSLRAE